MIFTIFLILMFGVFGKLLLFALKAAWGISRILISIVFLPIVLVGMALSGMLTLALILVVIIGIYSLIVR